MKVYIPTAAFVILLLLGKVLITSFLRMINSVETYRWSVILCEIIVRLFGYSTK